MIFKHDKWQSLKRSPGRTSAVGTHSTLNTEHSLQLLLLVTINVCCIHSRVMYWKAETYFDVIRVGNRQKSSDRSAF
jgi:hypothetical protein